MLYPLPAEIPTAEITSLVIAALRRETVDVKQAAHAAWQVAGFGINQWVKTPESPMVARGGSLTDEEAANVLQSMHASQGGIATTIPWELLLPVLVRLLERLLSGTP